MLRNIRLYGQLAKFVGRSVLKADLATTAEVVRMLIVNFPALEVHMADQHYKVLVGDTSLTLDDLHSPIGQEEIKIVPVVVGAGGGTGQILAGVGLIAASFLLPGAGLFGTTGAGLFGLSGQAIVGVSSIGVLNAAAFGTALSAIGASLVLSGVAQMISPVPATPQGADTQQDPRKSFSFSGVQNTSRGGTPVPIVYGKTLTGSVVISAGIDTVQVRT
jgi:predicted phage tail protein